MTGTVTLRAGGLVPSADAARHPRRLRFTAGATDWSVAAAEATNIALDGDEVALRPSGDGRLVLGPVPSGGDEAFEARAEAVAAHPLLGTSEQVRVEADGSTTQVLTQQRGPLAGTTSLWALQPHHRAHGVGLGPALGSVPSARGPLPVVAGDELRLEYPAVPVLWSAVPLPEAAPPVAEDPVGVEGDGSYFGAKAAYAWAARADAWRAAGETEAARAATREAARRLEALRDPDASPRVTWDDRWGSAIVEPAEMGAGTELNDHQLQAGYWVAAASHVAEADPEAGDRLRPLVDLLVADYAGAAVVPGASTSLPAERTWSPYAGHSWASGTAPFDDGNDLESSSESAFAWWAAARWFIATDRAEDAAAFIGRLTIETAVAGVDWLPQGDHLPEDPADRPWTGVVWSAKTDLGTWFDPRAESALGIRLLPLGPSALARYGSRPAVAAAEARWDWCERYGAGCTARWANLLDSDAAVAGRPPLEGPDPEPSTSAVLVDWWRDVWTRTEVVTGWACSVGVVPRRQPDGTVTILASNPGPARATMQCRDPDGVLRWTASVGRTWSGTASEGP